MTVDKYMMATRAFHLLGDISRDEEDLCHVSEETPTHWIGSWVEGYGFVKVKFPKETTRDLTDEEIEKYNAKVLQVASWPPFKLDIPRRKACLP